MITLQELDSSTPLHAQLQEKTGPVVVVNTFIAPEGEVDAVLAAWELDAKYMKSQPGFVSAQLHRGIGSSRALVNVATWESTEALRDALTAPEFQATLERYPAGTVASPHIFRKVAVDGVCVG